MLSNRLISVLYACNAYNMLAYSFNPILQYKMSPKIPSRVKLQIILIYKISQS